MRAPATERLANAGIDRLRQPLLGAIAQWAAEVAPDRMDLSGYRHGILAGETTSPPDSDDAPTDLNTSAKSY